MTLQATDAATPGTAVLAAKGFFQLAVSELRREADGVVSVILRDPDGGALPVWEPGAHVDVLLSNGILRQYSLCSEPADRSAWRIAVLREQPGRGGSSFVHEVLRAGDVLHVRGPKNNFRGTAGSGKKVFIAGGIGITPLLPMIRAAQMNGEPWRLLYLGSNVHSMAFLDEIAGLDPAGAKSRLHAKEESGALDLIGYLREEGLNADSTVYACGPRRLLSELRSANRTGVVPQLLFEDFGHDESDAGAGPGGSAPAGSRWEAGMGQEIGNAVRDNSPFVVETVDGIEIDVAENETILDALQRSGVPALNSCRKGTCGTCETVVLAGIPDHRDEILSDEERAANETMMICVSRCRGERLVLEL
ncbi:PDR/VanB family oxidoreductase [Arthrobacter sp. B2a2-09]|uniref:PDR/VanB family oxidoreductase n=1 Tax=Arthrobacter sp. B2a2-09 TaxID=2952822 RepID=UPI0022CD3AA6|nr:PDR/VanB family oxidoreductase [Arthrobacter sp. B2a2-09]MCZ9883467.1 PDR/VanB family oxidoreductase [Arthrobacter sp. B2a2-09]